MFRRFACLSGAVLMLTVVTSVSWAEQVRVGDIVINKDGVKMPGVEISKDGVRAGDVTVTEGGVQANGVTVEAPDALDAGEPMDPVGASAAEGPNWDRREFVGTNMNGADLSDHSLRETVFQSADFNRANFRGADLTDASLQSSDFNMAGFSGALLRNARLQSSDFNGADFSNANLRGAKLQSSDFVGANFRGACLINAKIQSSDIDGADFTGAVMTGAKLANNDQRGTKMDGAIWQGAVCPGAPVVPSPRPDLTNADAIQDALIAGPDARVDLTVNFATDSDKIVGQAHAQVFEIAKALKSDALANTRIMIEGHTDSVGKSDYNTDLSFRRAMSVMRALSTDHNVDAGRISIMGYGEDQPVSTNDTEEGRALNRRVTLVRLGD